MSQTTIQTYREIGLVYLDTDGCNTNFFSVAHARDSPIPSEQGYLSLLSLLYHVFNLQSLNIDPANKQRDDTSLELF